jgi:hypothetical protein
LILGAFTLVSDEVMRRSGELEPYDNDSAPEVTLIGHGAVKAISEGHNMK